MKWEDNLGNWQYKEINAVTITNYNFLTKNLQSTQKKKAQIF